MNKKDTAIESAGGYKFQFFAFVYYFLVSDNNIYGLYEYYDDFCFVAVKDNIKEFHVYQSKKTDKSKKNISLNDLLKILKNFKFDNIEFIPENLSFGDINKELVINSNVAISINKKEYTNQVVEFDSFSENFFKNIDSKFSELFGWEFNKNNFIKLLNNERLTIKTKTLSMNTLEISEYEQRKNIFLGLPFIRKIIDIFKVDDAEIIFNSIYKLDLSETERSKKLKNKIKKEKFKPKIENFLEKKELETFFVKVVSFDWKLKKCIDDITRDINNELELSFSNNSLKDNFLLLLCEGFRRKKISKVDDVFIKKALLKLSPENLLINMGLECPESNILFYAVLKDIDSVIKNETINKQDILKNFLIDKYKGGNKFNSLLLEDWIALYAWGLK